MTCDAQSGRYWNYWGKAKPVEGGPDYHRLVYHSLDVAAVGAAYLRQSPQLLRWFCSRLGCSSAAFISWSSFFLALHDIGKFSESFQAQRPDLLQLLQRREVTAHYDAVRHDTLGFWIWRDLVRNGLLERLALSGEPQALQSWLRAVCGHHGMPPSDSGAADRYFREDDSAAVADFVEAMSQLLLTKEARQLAELYEEDFADHSQSLSWWFAGVAVLADWLGSNTKFFPYQTDARELQVYWEDAQDSAQRALQASGVLPVAVAPDKTLRDFFPYIKQASPLQAWAEQTELPASPQIHILEDVTGAGKTEAAMMLAYRLMAQGAAQGFFIGLPTMATANAMYERVAKVYHHLFEGDASMALAHGYKDLVERFAESVLPESVSERDASQYDDTASARCTAWLADHNKRALLAPAGVGTIDQALLAVLHSKHQSLRLLGLFNKVLIIDEVHACDTYMEGILRVVLEFHASAGGSVILLSATLPQRTKTALLHAYARGRGRKLGAAPRNEAYPLTTRWNDGMATPHEEALASRANVSRTVRVRYLSDEARLCAEILDALSRGLCVGWIRNTVADAMDAYVHLARYLAPETITLFHARFALADRLRTEGAILTLFDSDSDAERRAGRLMIATQVAEQSLDVDFDVLVTDLAPIDRVLQRAGRAQRHVRDARGNRLLAPGGVDGRDAPAIWVLAPPWTETPAADWYGAQFKTAQYVYGNHGQMWLTAKALQEGHFSMPGDARRLIEMVYSGEEATPVALDSNVAKAEGQGHAEASQAQMNCVSLVNGYRRGVLGDWWADLITPSRLGEETREVMLAKWEDGRLLRWHDGVWAYSVVKMSAWKMERVEEPGDAGSLQAYEALRATLPGQGKYCLLLPLELQADGTWQGQAWTGANESTKQAAQLLIWVYDVDLGLRVRESAAAEATAD